MRNFRNIGSRNRSRNRSRHSKSNGLDINKLIRTAIAPKDELIYTSNYQFSDLELSSELKDNILRKGYKTPTPIQDQAIPHILNGKDVVGIANTGTGKTGAFLIPLLDKVFKDKRQKVLIVAPTRELAEQIDKELWSLTKGMNIRSALCVGGVSINAQIMKLRSNVQFVVGTPGRLKDLMNRNELLIQNFRTIVLDEVDRMLDMGFIEDIKFIIDQLPEGRHSLFFSATITPTIERLMNDFVKDYIKISVKTGETSDHVHQDIIRVTDVEDKKVKLEELLITEDCKKVIVFVRTKHGVEKLDKHLYQKGFRVDSLHGNKTQSKRKMALDRFKRGSSNILVATDVAARGLDVPDVTHVINFDMPDTYEDYVHRIGRTGRASKVGYALTFVEKKFY